MISIARNRALAPNSRLVLMAGFGGLLLLMAFAEFDGMQALTQIQRSNDEFAPTSTSPAHTSVTTCWSRKAAKRRATAIACWKAAATWMRLSANTGNW
jgi:hypothetical protein